MQKYLNIDSAYISTLQNDKLSNNFKKKMGHRKF